MKPRKGEAAVGAKKRARLHPHDFLAIDSSLRSKALRLQVAAQDLAGELAVGVVITNVGAAHGIPTGFPGRRVVLRARSLDLEGREIASEERSYARVLADATGNEVPYFLATQLREDTRLMPDMPRQETLTLKAPEGEGRLIVDLVWRAFSPTLARAPRSAPQEILLAQAVLQFGARRPAGGRAQLPKKIEVNK
jgi:hypothetical protein